MIESPYRFVGTPAARLYDSIPCGTLWYQRFCWSFFPHPWLLS